MPRANILIVDQDPAWNQLLSDLLIHGDHEVFSVGSADEALAIMQTKAFDLVVAEINLPGSDGLPMVEQIRKAQPNAALIVHTANASITQAVEATKLGAAEYLEKSRAVSALETLQSKISAKLRRLSRVTVPKPPEKYRQPANETFHGMVSQNQKMYDVFELIETVADSFANVLIHGETGTGKELVARAIHGASGRQAKPFITVDCSTLAHELLESELFGHEKGAFTGATERHVGRFERANSGTLFLDEVANIGLPVQAKLLRVLQTRTFERVGSAKSLSVDVRIIAASNRPLEECVADGSFREDLYHRLNVVQVELPALRDRREDISLLANEFLRRYARQNGRDVRGFTDEAMKYLNGFNWPGNVRELENVVLQAVVLAKAPLVGETDLPRRITQSTSPVPATTLADQLGEPEKQIILDALRQHGGNIKRTAGMLKVSRTTLYTKLRKYNIDPNEIR